MNIYSTISDFAYLKRNFHWIFKNKAFNLLLQHLIEDWINKCNKIEIHLKLILDMFAFLYKNYVMLLFYINSSCKSLEKDQYREICTNATSPKPSFGK